MSTILQDELNISKLFDALVESVILFKPVIGINDEVTDFEIAYCNNASSIYFGAPKEVIVSQTILNTSLIPAAEKKATF